MANYDALKEEYNTGAESYTVFEHVPYGRLESQLFAAALGDATGKTVLDLGGGTGLKARLALDAGAAAVDIVDISTEMMNIGRAIEDKLGRKKIRYFEADVSKPWIHPEPNKQYDVVMANWLFDHATSEEALEGMWQNTVAYLKPGGRFVSLRCGNPRCPAMVTAKYGFGYRDIEDIPGGVKLRYFAVVDGPPVDFEATLMETSYSGSTKLHEKYGLEDIKIEPFENIKWIQEDPEYWKIFLEDPPMIAVKAKKKIE